MNFLSSVHRLYMTEPYFPDGEEVREEDRPLTLQGHNQKKLKAMSGEDSGKDNPTNECPVCYERLQNPNISERRLSCGHSFCHDCLVKYLMTAKKEGSIKKNIICPLCRYVTFLSKRGLILPPNAGELNQILEVPHSPSCLTHSTVVGNPNTLVIPIPETSGSHSPQDLCRCTCSVDTSPDLIGNSCSSQVFIISDQGQPMECSDEVVTSNETHHIDARANCCRSPSLIMILLLIFLVAVLAAVLPWILLVKKT
ncbi:RING finger protein 222 isoform X1 [Bufo gargarizans]|uniref:RING finger protein 222 isoform X1 n=2 Tax=Bufo gargarizans TaxID=30331 RepID=UPI001CF123D9|nr:RING finger protein 222 isoform X1 [Bufo gargarizans]